MLDVLEIMQRDLSVNIHRSSAELMHLGVALVLLSAPLTSSLSALAAMAAARLLLLQLLLLLQRLQLRLSPFLHGAACGEYHKQHLHPIVVDAP